MLRLFQYTKTILLIVIFSIVTITISSTSFFLLFKNAQNGVYERLTDIVNREKSSISILVSRYHASEYEIIEYLGLVRKSNSAIGQQGEVFFVRQKNDSIEFIATTPGTNPSDKISQKEANSSPLSSLFFKKSGTIECNDFKNRKVYAAFANVESLKLAIVAEIPTDEISRSFKTNLLFVLILTMLIITFCAYIFIFPLFDKIYRNEYELRM